MKRTLWIYTHTHNEHTHTFFLMFFQITLINLTCFKSINIQKPQNQLGFGGRRVLNKDRPCQQRTQWPVVSAVLEESVRGFPHCGQDKQQRAEIAEHTMSLLSSAVLLGCLRPFSLAGQCRIYISNQAGSAYVLELLCWSGLNAPLRLAPLLWCYDL